jgi:competence protein CoiA
MENCLYHGKTICTFDLKDESGMYYEDMVLQWKQAAADRLLTCEECQSNVYLAAGPIKEPYFAHYDLAECDYSKGHETEELKKGKRLLYHMLKRSFPDGEIRARYRLENGMYSTLFYRVSDEKAIAVDYRLQNNSLKKYNLRDTFYQANSIKPFYICGIRQEKDTIQPDWYQNLLQAAMGYVAFLNTEKETLTLKKSFSYRLGKDRRFRHCRKTYPIKELSIGAEGQIVCDFSEECSKIEHQIQEEKISYQKRQNILHLLREENQRLQEQDAERQEAYRRRKEQERLQGSGLIDQPGTGKGSTGQDTVISDLNPIILEKCRKMIEEGNAHLVSKKYYDAIMGIQVKQ